MMTRLAYSFFLVLLAAGLPLFGQLPEYYKSVDRLVWVVEDLDGTIEGLNKLGFTYVRDLGEVELSAVEFRGKPATGTARVASGRFGDVAVHWIQPSEGTNAFAEFSEKHGSGVFSLVHRAPTWDAFHNELQRMQKLGVGILQQGSLRSGSERIRWAFLDTEPEGKYVLGLVHFPAADEGPLAIPPDNPSGRTVSQYAFAVRELEPVSEFWARLGFPEMSFTHGERRNRRYRGQLGQFDMRLGWQRHGKVAYEWIQSLKGPDVYLDHMAKHGESFHHLAFHVDDMDKEIARWEEWGFPEGMSGAWGEEGKPGSGRFSYQDTHSIGGIDVELLWNFR